MNIYDFTVTTKALLLCRIKECRLQGGGLCKKYMHTGVNKYDGWV